MPQFATANLVDGVGSLASKINAIIADIKTAFNKLDATNFDGSSNIPNAALARPKAYFPGDLKKEAQIIAATPVTTIQDEYNVPCDCDLVGVQVVAETVVGGALIDIYLVRGTPASPTINQTILAAQIALGAGNNIKGTGTPSLTSFLKGDLVSLRAVTAGGQTVDILHATLLFKKAHAS